MSSVVTVNNRTARRRRGGRTRSAFTFHSLSVGRRRSLARPLFVFWYDSPLPRDVTRKWRGVRCILTEIRRNPSPSFCGAPLADVDFWPVGLLPPPCAVLISAAPKESSFVPKMERSDLALGASLSPFPPRHAPFDRTPPASAASSCQELISLFPSFSWHPAPKSKFLCEITCHVQQVTASLSFV